MLRAAEILEWLSHPDLNSDELPMDLLAASAYQLAGFPARAAGILNSRTEFRSRSDILRPLLSGDFPGLFGELAKRWAETPRNARDYVDIWSVNGKGEATWRRLVELESTSALGVLCALMRWGSERRIDAALGKLDAISGFMLNGRDRYSWLLAKLVSETCRTFVNTSLRSSLAWLSRELGESGNIALERYLRQAYRSCKTQAWPSQKRGIERLEAGNSFVLCTPTGSGKTTVAEIAILQRLFSVDYDITHDLPIAPLVIYLVPKRALAAEVEAKLLRTISPLAQRKVVITGLYGGIDWGPTDAWLANGERTVLICTYEKAEALLRFLGPLFLARLALIVLDEAQMIQFEGNTEDLRRGESRSLRLESLIARLLVHVPEDQCRVIGLSAVAYGIEDILSAGLPATINWVQPEQYIAALVNLSDGCNAGLIGDLTSATICSIELT